MNFLRPITPAITGPELIPIRKVSFLPRFTAYAMTKLLADTHDQFVRKAIQALRYAAKPSLAKRLGPIVVRASDIGGL